jgi:hypothetical protein
MVGTVCGLCFMQVFETKQKMIPMKQIYFARQNVRSTIQIGQDLFMIGFAHSRTERFTDRTLKPRYAIFYPSGKTKSVLEVKS